MVVTVRVRSVSGLPNMLGPSNCRVSDSELSHDVSKVWLTLNCNEEMG